MWKSYTKLSMCKSKTLNISLDFADILWFHAICISKGCIQICEPLETFNPVLTCASNHPQNILDASPPSPDVLSCIHAACISALLMQNIHQIFTNIQLIIWAFIQHFIHITPRSLNIYIAEDHAWAHAPVFICSHQSGLFVHNLWCLALISDQLPRIAIPHLHSLKSIGAWFSFDFFFLIYI